MPVGTNDGIHRCDGVNELNNIDNAPLTTPFEFDQAELNTDTERFAGVISQFAWIQWFNQIVQALFRPTVTVPVLFGLTPAQSSSDFVVTFPAGLVSAIDIPVLQSPIPPAGTSFTVHMGAGKDQVVIRFNNYSAAPIGTGVPQNFVITVLKQ